ncbi:hypothetical protein PV08_03881 [Exophiala spinifera]|uniref:Uncharacterized protein n=1 Tax=Exophiala spinifera TaxID=91928 RepID=A0A0D2BCI9_9EURO|nr:uncharacterized protein PV08_03881 [Exophiala spinifera]KIW16693.1 hypothetical protein PV08_03881 [Exophiala spinifera]
MAPEKPVPSSSSSSSSPGGETDSSLSRLAGRLQGAITKTVTTSGRAIDRFLPPQRRERWKDAIVAFASKRPYLAGFLALQIVMNGVPLVLFACTTVSIFIFSLLTGILVGILGGLLFVVPAIGLGLLLLMPLLFFTTAAAVCVWIWAVAAYATVNWLGSGRREDTAAPPQSGGTTKTVGANGANGATPPTRQGALGQPNPVPTTAVGGGNGSGLQPSPEMNGGGRHAEQPATTSPPPPPTSQLRRGEVQQLHAVDSPSTKQPDLDTSMLGVQPDSSSEGTQSHGHTPSNSNSSTSTSSNGSNGNSGAIDGV